MRVALVQVAYGDGETVVERTDRVTRLTRDEVRGVDLVVLPELWPVGAFAADAWAAAAQQIDGPLVAQLSSLARELGVVLHGGSIIEAETRDGRQHLWNTSLLFGRGGELLARYRKIHLFGAAGREPEILDAGDAAVTCDLPLPGTPRAGLSTCYDLRFPELYRATVADGAELLVIPAAWPTARLEAWDLLTRARAMENQAWVLAVNTAGTHAGVEMGGHSRVVDPTGRVTVEAGSGEEVLVTDVDTERARSVRSGFPVLRDRVFSVEMPRSTMSG